MNRIYTLFFSISIFIACGKTNKETNKRLKEFRIGEFYYDTLGYHFEIIRDSAIQIERYKVNNIESELVFKINWESDSLYTLELKESNTFGCLKVGDKLRNEVFNIGQDKSYIVKYSTEKCGSGYVKIISK